MRRLILIKHAAPQVVPGVPPERWALSDDGRRRCAALADAVRPHAPAAVVTSAEPKAVETGELLAAALGLPAATAAGGLGEHDRSDVPHLPTREFISLMEVVFRRPAERVLGRESAADALARFERALAAVLAAHAGPGSAAAGAAMAPPLAVVSHGTVIALLLAKHGGGRAFDLWRRMGLPSIAVLDLPDDRSGGGDVPVRGRVVDVVERVG